MYPETSTKAEFYELLGKVLSKTQRGDIVIMMGDFNAQVGFDNNGVETTMGKHGLGRKTDNERILLDTCSTNNLVIGGTVFSTQENIVWHWYHPTVLRRIGYTITISKNGVVHF